MKKIIIALAVLGFTWAGAQAQTNKCNPPGRVKAHKKVAYTVHRSTNMRAKSNTYQVCREEGGYYVCCLHKDSSLRPLTDK